MLEMYMILLIFNFFTGIFVFVLALRSYFKSRSQIEWYVMMVETLLMSFIVFRLLEIIFFIPLEVGRILFIINNGLLGSAAVAAVYTLLRFIREATSQIQKANFVLIYTGVIAIVSFSLNVNTHVYFTVDGHNIFGMLPIQFFPVTGFIFISILFVIKHIIQATKLYDQEIRRKMNTYLLLIIIYIISACYLAAVHTLELLLMTSIMLQFALTGLIVSFYDEPDVLSKFWSYFSIQSIHVIHKDGRTMFSHDFLQQKEEEVASMEMLLIGGFIHAITQGIEQITKIKASIKLIDLQKVKLAFYFGMHCFGILFTKEINDRIHEKLKSFMKEFELRYGPIIRNWDGNLEPFKKGILISENGLQTKLTAHSLLERHFKI